MSSDPLFVDLKEVNTETGADVTVIESVCLQCHKNGNTRILLTKIPYFKEVAVMSFYCEHCEWSNNELQPVATIQEKGVVYTVKCTTEQDLNREVIKTEWAEIDIPEIEFEVKKQSGLITTIEGIIDRAITGLNETLQSIPEEDKESKMKFSEFIGKLVRLKMLNEPFTFILDDPSGNSFVQNPLAPEPDPKMQIKHYVRTLEQDKLIGCVSSENNENDADKDFNITGEVLTFPTNCSECNAPCFTNMKVTKIPYFKEVIIMATNCDACGERTNEIKSGAGIEEKGVKITKLIRDENDLKLDVVRSDTCSVSIPEVDVEVSFSANGRYTTIEGLIQSIKEELKRTNPFICGDSATNDTKEKMDALFNKLENLVGLTVILDDPCGNSFVEKADNVQNYERTFEQNEELGLNDMKTENYTSNS